jgi:hypothetical protein
LGDVDGNPDVDVHELGLHGEEEGVARCQLTRSTAALYSTIYRIPITPDSIEH